MKLEWEQGKERRRGELIRKNQKAYMNKVHDNHLPSISYKKRQQLEAVKQLLGKPKVRPLPETLPFYNVDTYKKDPTKSIDWTEKPNPLIPLPKVKRNFVKIDYMYYESKEEALRLTN